MKQKFLVERHKNKIFPFFQTASNGYKSLEQLFFWYNHFNDVSVLFMDEFDAFYHFDLAQNVLKYISSNNNIQVILTTNNSILASNAILRPDCYYILKDGKLTSFTNSVKREIREEHNLEKMLRNKEFDS